MTSCSILFVIVYGLCNWITAGRAYVGTWYYQWETHIPFVPAMIVPYWSLDLFFVGSFFLCRTRSELTTLGKRIVLAITVAGVCFLLFPLQLGFSRPAVAGPFGELFRILHSFDKPYNLFPSLHITLCTILSVTWTRYSHGIVRRMVQLWFILIGASTVLTYQHQVVDVMGGLFLAALCFYIFPASMPTFDRARNVRVAVYYGFGAVGTLSLAIVAPNFRLALLWSAAALVLMTAAYAGLGPAIFRKESGRLPLSTWIVLGPCLLGHYVSLLYYNRRCRPWDEVVPGVLMGRMLAEEQTGAAIRKGVIAVLDLTAEFSEPASFRKVIYKNLPVLDLTAPTLEQLTKAAAFIEENVKNGKVYVHCKIGYSRSAAAVGAYLLQSGNADTVEQALDVMHRARPTLIVRPEAHNALCLFEAAIKGDNSDSSRWPATEERKPLLPFSIARP